MKEKKELIINFVAIVAAFLINALTNFFLSSYVVNAVSEEAYGFVQLSNTFINYFTVITLAINSMASRFVAISYYKNNKEEAKGYYSASFWANVIISIIIIPIISILILNLEKLINISPELIGDVKLLFTFLAGNLVLGLLTTNLAISFYIKNKLYIQSMINMVGYILKAVLLYIIYLKCSPYIAFFGLVTLIVTSIVQTINLYYKVKLIPEIKIGKLELNKIKDLLFSGVWNSVTRLGSILSEGLDLLITNLFLDSISMGILAIVKIIPNIIGGILNNLVSIFMPSMTKVYAKGSKEELKKSISDAMGFVGIFLNIPIVCVIVFGKNLFGLWFPMQDGTLLLILSILSIIHWIVIGPVSIMHNVFTIINKIKTNSILVVLTGFLNILLVYITLKMTNWGLYAVVGISCMLSILRNVIYTLPYGAKYIGLPWYSFFPEIGRSGICVLINTIIGFGINYFFHPTTWGSLLTIGILFCIICLVVNSMIFINKETRNKLILKIKGVKQNG